VWVDAQRLNSTARPNHSKDHVCTFLVVVGTREDHGEEADMADFGRVRRYDTGLTSSDSDSELLTSRPEPGKRRRSQSANPAVSDDDGEFDVIMPYVPRLAAGPAATSGRVRRDAPTASASAAARTAAAATLEATLEKASVYSTFLHRQIALALAEDDNQCGATGLPPPGADTVLNVSSGLSLLPHQRIGVRWLLALFENGVSGILADEMGLGKTVQVLAFIGRLLDLRVLGPHVIVCPLSTLSNWRAELARWLPGVPLVVFHGDAAARKGLKPRITKMARQLSNEMLTATAVPLAELLRHAGGVILTTYEMATKEATFLATAKIGAMIVDEAQRLKNFRCRLVHALKAIPCEGRFILSGTPVQNSLAELWSVLNFVAPDVFNCLSDFEAWFESEGDAARDEGVQVALAVDAQSAIRVLFERRRLRNLAEVSGNHAGASTTATSSVGPVEVPTAVKSQHAAAIVRMHRALRPFLLRRTKEGAALNLPPLIDVAVRCPLSKLQLRMYREAAKPYRRSQTPPPLRPEELQLPLRRGTATRRGAKSEEVAAATQPPPSFKSLRGLHVTQLRLLCGHPYLVPGGDPFHDTIVANGLHTRWPNDPALEKRYYDRLLSDSGKMRVLFRLLRRLMQAADTDGKPHHRVLIFSQFAFILDVLEELLGYYPLTLTDGLPGEVHRPANDAEAEAAPGALGYVRLDGAQGADARADAVRRFNAPASPFRIFLLTTRAGGVGLNLAAADTVVMVDGDYNPHNDIQAISRAHRIGQTRPVVTYRLIAEHTIEEAVLQFGLAKLRMERLVIGCGDFTGSQLERSADAAPEAIANVQVAEQRAAFEESEAAFVRSAAAALQAEEHLAAERVAQALVQEHTLTHATYDATADELSDEMLDRLTDRSRLVQERGVLDGGVTIA
jgi:ATP-dependent DNA helicase